MIKTVSIQKGITRARLQILLERIRKLRIGVLGDFTLDGYWYADMTRSQLSREAPLYPRPVVRETYSCGGAANVAWNLCDLGVGEVRALTILGQDWRGELLEEALEKVGVAPGSIVRSAEWLTPFYGKVILTSGSLQQEDSRLDFINPQPPPAAAVQALLAEVRRQLPRLDSLVIADYHPQGIVAGLSVEMVNHLAVEFSHLTCLVDSRDRFQGFRGMLLKPNDLEAARLLLPGRAEGDIALEELARAGLARENPQNLPLFITLGSRGCLVLADGQAVHIPAVQVPPPIDPVGAGDSFLAALAGGLSAGTSAREAACLANLAAAVTVRKLRITGTASPDEILQVYDSLRER